MSRSRVVCAAACCGAGRCRWWLAVSLVAAAAAAWPHVGYAQKLKVSGTVRDSAGAPIAGADVSIPAAHLLTRTGEAGTFSLDRVPAGRVELSVRRLGYAPQTLQLDLPVTGDTLTVHMVAKPLDLPGMEISDQAKRRLLWIEDFYRRMVHGQGTYVTRQDIASRHATRLSDALLGVPGLSLVRRGVHGGMGIRFMNSSVIRRDCVPQYWLDGVRADDVEIDDFSPTDIEGVELYQGPSTTPLQFSQGATTKCGAVVIWTRVPGT